MALLGQSVLAWSLFAYLVAAIPMGVLVGLVRGVDIRRLGSGNIGATNVLRTGNKGAAFATLLLDGGKGALAVMIARCLLAEDAAQLAGLAAFVGHLFPVWLGFKGGKGVATFLGTLLALAWPAGLAACATWAVVALVTRISSLSALVAAALAVVWAALLGHGDLTFLIVAMATLVFYKHLPNIARIQAGTEPRIGQK